MGTLVCYCISYNKAEGEREVKKEKKKKILLPPGLWIITSNNTQVKRREEKRKNVNSNADGDGIEWGYTAS